MLSTTFQIIVHRSSLSCSLCCWSALKQPFTHSSIFYTFGIWNASEIKSFCSSPEYEHCSVMLVLMISVLAFRQNQPIAGLSCLLGYLSSRFWSRKLTTSSDLMTKMRRLISKWISEKNLMVFGTKLNISILKSCLTAVINNIFCWHQTAECFEV